MSERNVNPVPDSAACSDGLHAGLGALPHWLVHHAARRAPPDLSERLEEEWRADLAARSSAISRLRFAIGCCWATSVIAREHGPGSIPIASAAVGSKITLGYTRDESGMFARRSITFFLVAGLHIALFYGLMTGLAFRIIKVIPTSIQARMLRPAQERVLPPLAPSPRTNSKLEIPIPDFPRTEGSIENKEIIAEPQRFASSWPEAPPAVALREIVRVPGGPGSGFPNTDDYYPSIAKRMEEQGSATIGVCVGADGKLTADPTIAQSSGSPRLDAGALLLAKAGSGHYRAGTDDGRAVSSCYSFRVRFALRTER